MKVGEDEEEVESVSCGRLEGMSLGIINVTLVDLIFFLEGRGLDFCKVFFLGEERWERDQAGLVREILWIG